jgi:drug/metabolite transporter (DMT)-like permease
MAPPWCAGLWQGGAKIMRNWPDLSWLLCAVLSFVVLLPVLQARTDPLLPMFLALSFALAFAAVAGTWVSLYANQTVRHRWRRRCLWALLAMGIAVGIPTFGFHIKNRNAWDEQELFIALLVQVAAPLLVTTLWNRHRRRADLQQGAEE